MNSIKVTGKHTALKIIVKILTDNLNRQTVRYGPSALQKYAKNASNQQQPLWTIFLCYSHHIPIRQCYRN